MLETNLAIRGTQRIQETESEFTRSGKTAISPYNTSIGVQRSELNTFLDGARTVAVNVGQFFEGTAYYVGKLFSACFPRSGGKQAVIERLVEEHALQYDIAEVHCARFSYILCHFLPDETEDELSLKIAPLVHLIARWKAIAGMTSFLMLTQPSSYKGSSYAEAFECWQRLVDLYERGLVKQSVVTALSDFHLNKIPVQKLLTIVHEAECAELFPSKDPSFEVGDGREIKNLHTIHDIIACGPAKQHSNLDSFSPCMNAARSILKGGMFSLLLNPVSYYHVVDVAPMKNILHILETILQKGGSVSPSLEAFYHARVSLHGLERALEKRLTEMAGGIGVEEPVEAVLQRFCRLDPSDQRDMAEHYRTICKKGEPLRDVGMNTLISHVRSLQENCRRGPLSKEDALFLLAIARESIRKHFGIYPHNTQMLTVLGLVHHPARIKGRIAQVKTGEGKSVIIAMLALYLACQGKYVDIISSSRYLAQRDAEKYGGYFARFGISTSHLCTDSPTAANFSGQILFSTNFDAEFSVMRDYFAATPMRTVGACTQTTPRPADVVIVDEVDNLFIDSALNSARIAIEGSMSMLDVYIPLFHFVKEKLETLLPLLHDPSFRQATPFAEAKQIVRDSIKGFPEMVELFLDEKVEMLLQSAVRSLEVSEGKDYIVRSVGERKEIVIVDQSNTGRLAEKSRWSHGLHQFLQVKHEVPIDEEHVMPASLCHPTHFGDFNRIYGLTGTIGSELERRELQETYSITTFDVPPYRPCLRHDLEPQVCLTTQDHFDAIVTDINEMRAKGRPTLVLCETIQQANELARYGSSRGISSLTLTACQSDDEDFIITQAGFPGKVTIATNTAGRGTDILLQKEALLAGGLHVIFIYLPVNERVEQQGIGRAGRQGQPGSSRIILLVDSPILALLSDALKSGERQKLHKIGYTLFLTQREERVARLSAERMLRTEIERINHGYLLLFVKQFQAWLKAPDRHVGALAVTQDRLTRKQGIQQLWAEQFYSRLDELFVQVQTQCRGDKDVIVSRYKDEIQKFFETAKQAWEKVFNVGAHAT